jgi:ectoine hydroxylase-related dioxygenase (phytanoyl-CoA dioxygenase family)
MTFELRPIWRKKQMVCGFYGRLEESSMTEIERYMYDVNGYIVVENALSAEQVASINRLFDEKIKALDKPDNPNISFPHIIGWRGPMLDLIDNPRITPYLETICWEKFRLDHTYALNIKPGYESGGAYILHCGKKPFDPQHHYSYHDGKIYGGETAVVYLLNDAREGEGGFGCIPGTHKSNFNIPEEFRDMRKPKKEYINVAGPAGSAIIFTESLSHGTLPWKGKRDRRTLYYKYAPHCIGIGEMYLDEASQGWPELTDRQREILEAPNARGKERKRLKAFV